MNMKQWPSTSFAAYLQNDHIAVCTYRNMFYPMEIYIYIFIIVCPTDPQTSWYLHYNPRFIELPCRTRVDGSGGWIHRLVAPSTSPVHISQYITLQYPKLHSVCIHISQYITLQYLNSYSLYLFPYLTIHNPPLSLLLFSLFFSISHNT